MVEHCQGKMTKCAILHNNTTGYNMKAISFYKYGMTKDLTICEVDKPIPKENEVLVKIHASSINDWDWGLLRGKPFVNKLIFGLFKPKVKTLGCDIAGTIEAKGVNANKFNLHDKVLGDVSGERMGGFAEYVCVNEKVLELKSENLSFLEAAAFPQAGVLAIQGFMEEWKIEKGQKVLINGAGGGTGTFAIQIAKQLGAIVTGVDKQMKFDIMLEASADNVIDYLKEDFTKNGVQYDYILDLAGHHPFFDYKNALAKHGKYLLVGGSSTLIISCIFFGPLVSLFSNKKMKILAHVPNKYLSQLMELSQQGTLKPFIDKIFPLKHVPKALDYFGQGECKGKIIISTID